MDTRGTYSRPAHLHVLSPLKNVLWWAHGYESYVNERDHQETAHKITGSSNRLELRSNERKGGVLLPMDIQRMASPQGKLQSLLFKELKTVGVAPMEEAVMQGIENILVEALELQFHSANMGIESAFPVS